MQTQVKPESKLEVALREARENPTGFALAAIECVEEALGNNLQWITDQADLGIRQRDKETLDRLAQLSAAWTRTTVAMATLRKILREGM